MVRRSLLLALAAAANYARAVKTVPGAYIVELADGVDPATFYKQTPQATPRMNITYPLFRGVSIQIKDTPNADAHAFTIMSMPIVKHMWPLQVYTVPPHEVQWTGNSTANMPLVQNRQTAAQDTFSTHTMTQVDRLRAEGYTGKGIKLAIIDTGIDYKHPALGGCFGPGCLVSYGTDLVGDNYNGFNTPVPDADPWDGCGGHGSHVAGIVAAQPNPFGFTGAAPGVTIGAFRVFGCEGQTGTDVLIDAYMRAYEAGSQIITASIGGSSGWSEDPWAVAVQRIVEKGVPCMVAAGNEGSSGMFYASTAANGKRVTAIASVDNVVTPTLLVNSKFSVADAAEQDFGFSPGDPSSWGGVKLPLWALSFDTADPANGCDAFPDSTPDLSGFIVLIRRGTCTFVQKVTNAAAKGAKYVIIYNNVETGANGPSAGVPGIEGVAMITARQGVAFVNLLANGTKVTLDMEDPLTAPKILSNDANSASGGYLSTFTTWGPTFEADVKPQFGAPGGNILATYPVPLGSYAVLSGTSMATPFAAGVVALIAEARGSFDPALIENALASTAKPARFNDGRTTTASLFAPIPQQGGGLIQAWDAAHTTTHFSVSSLAFNDTDHAAAQSFTVTNAGSSPVSYQFYSVGAATSYALAAGSIYPAGFPPELSAVSATLTFSPASVDVAPGASAAISVSAAPPAGLDASRLPVYSGYVAVNGSDGSSFTLPFQGVAGSMKAAQVLDTDPGATFLFGSVNGSSTPAAAKSTFLLPKPGANTTSTSPSTANYPSVQISLAMGTALLHVDVLSASSNQSVGAVPGYPMQWLARDPVSANFTGLLDDGTVVAEGTYKISVRALRIFAEPEKAESYDSAETVDFTISYEK